MTEKRFTDFWVCETGEVGLDDYGVEKRFTSSEFEDFLNELNPAKQCDGENRLFIKADVSYSDRWLYPSDVFRKEKNLNIALPNEREFMTGECIVTDKDDTAYSIDELVNLLNYFNRCTVSNKEFMELKEENEELKSENERLCNFNLHIILDKKNKEIEQLKSVNQELRKELQFDAEQYKIFIEVINEADDLICSHLSKHYQRQWKNFCKNREIDV